MPSASLVLSALLFDLSTTHVFYRPLIRPSHVNVSLCTGPAEFGLCPVNILVSLIYGDAHFSSWSEAYEHKREIMRP